MIQGQSKNTRKEELFFDLNEHVKRNVLQLDKHFYLQDVGIPQGSVLSSLLCSFYYGHLETKVIIPFLQKSAEPGNDKFSATENRNHVYSLPNNEAGVIVSSPKYMLLRFIDDFIFISTSKKQAASFFSRLRRGFREYNCYMNEAKFGLNFDADQVSGLASNRVYVGPDGIPFLGWSGLFINCRTLEVQADYTRSISGFLTNGAIKPAVECNLWVFSAFLDIVLVLVHFLGTIATLFLLKLEDGSITHQNKVHILF